MLYRNEDSLMHYNYMEHYDVIGAMMLTYKFEDSGLYSKHMPNIKSNKIK